MEDKKEKIKPELPGGFRDLLPADAIAFQSVLDRIRRVYESFGYSPLFTPAMERVEVLTGGAEDFEKSLFYARIRKGAEDKNDQAVNEGEVFGLRFDHTVALARVMAANSDLSKPFKRYAIGPVWRGERPQAGRYREFWQADFDIIGSDSTLADVEVVQIMQAVLAELGLRRFLIRFNTRKVLNGLAEVVGAADRAKHVCRSIDKMDKLGLERVLAELKDGEAALNDEQAGRIGEFLKIKALDNDETLRQLEGFIAGKGETALAGLAELKNMVSALRELGVPEENWRVDLSIARGLDYYTGPVFETVLLDKPELGSIFSGGRFNDLVRRFVEADIPGVGASVGVSRLMIALKEFGLLPDKKNVTEVLVVPVFDPALEVKAAAVAARLRAGGLNADLYRSSGKEKSTPRGGVGFASREGIPYVLIIGPDEAAQGAVLFKDMKAGEQFPLAIEDCLKKIKTGLGR